jgi:hypothetical protein
MVAAAAAVAGRARSCGGDEFIGRRTGGTGDGNTNGRLVLLLEDIFYNYVLGVLNNETVEASFSLVSTKTQLIHLNDRFDRGHNNEVMKQVCVISKTFNDKLNPLLSYSKE